MYGGLALRVAHVRRSCLVSVYRLKSIFRKTYLANALQYAYRVLEESDVEDRNDEFDVRIVPNTIHGRQPTSLAERTFLCCSLHREPRSVRHT